VYSLHGLAGPRDAGLHRRHGRHDLRTNWRNLRARGVSFTQALSLGHGFRVLLKQKHANLVIRMISTQASENFALAPFVRVLGQPNDKGPQTRNKLLGRFVGPRGTLS
jgi:hypothetical protein